MTAKIKYRFFHFTIFFVGILALTYSSVSFRSYAENSTSASSEVVWVILDFHGSWQQTGTVDAFADRTSRLAGEMLAKETWTVGKPIIFWFERATLPVFVQILNDPDSVINSLERSAQVPAGMFRKILIDPRAFTPPEVQAFEMLMREEYDEQLQIQMTKDQDRLEPPDVYRGKLENLKSGRSVANKYEYPPFESYLALLRTAAWSRLANDFFVAGSIDQALAASLRYNILSNLSMNLRDRRLASDIAREHSASPAVLHIVFRGASHDRLAPYLNQQGIPAKNIVIDSFRKQNPFEGLIADMESRAELFESGYRLSDREKNIASREYIKDLSALHYGERIHNDPVNKPFIAAVNDLSDRDLAEWRELMSAQAGDNHSKAEASWKWLLEKSSDLAKVIA